MKPEGVFSSLRITMSGLSAQMKRLNVISENIANAEKVADDNGNIYHRKRVVITAQEKYRTRSFGEQMSLSMKKTNDSHLIGGGVRSSRLSKPDTSSFEIIEEKGERLIFDPAHPKADENGYIRMPNVSTVEEMVDLVSASRLYEANVSVLKAAKQMAKKALEI